MDKHIIPSIIAGSQAELDERIGKVKDLVEWIQLDVMDGRFVKNKSLDFDFILPTTSCRFEAHLMVHDPIDWIEKNGTKVDTIILHEETCRGQDKHDAIRKKVAALGKNLGLAIKPDTQYEMIQHCLEYIHIILVMTVKPGNYGAKFLPEMLKKVKQMRKDHPGLEIEVDGGISLDTIGKANDAGANRFVVGSYLQDAEDVSSAIDALKKEIRKKGGSDGPD
ncbi:MAG: ribulose-phosphate 3-epimerase [Candidatus Woesearchaeota archaeon]